MSSAHHRSRQNTFVGLALDRAAVRREDGAWLEQLASGTTSRFLLLCSDGRALLAADGARLLELVDAHARLQSLPARVSFLGMAGAVGHFVVNIEAEEADLLRATHQAQALDLRSAARQLETFEAGLFAYGRALSFWQSRVRFCGACGAPTLLEAGGHRARCSALSCALEHFPRSDPAVIMIVTEGRACLLGRQPSWPERRFSTLAGFVEPGEALEDAVRREVQEEAGVDVIDCDYHSSQPWPFPSSLMLGFTARASSRETHLGSELAEARWFEPEELLSALADGSLILPPPLSVSFRLIEHWLRAETGLELLPLLGDVPWVAPSR